jgi:uncharacterized protein YjdB
MLARLSHPEILLLYVVASMTLLVACSGTTAAPMENPTRLPPQLPPANVNVQPVKPELPADTIVAGAGALKLRAVPRDENGNPLDPIWSVDWQSDNHEVAIPEAEPDERAVARVSGVNLGRATITANIRGKRGETTITVTPASVSIEPEAETIVAGAEPLQLRAVLLDANGNSLTGDAVTWKSNDPEVAKVDQHGVVKGVKSGQATITATSWGVDGKAIVYVQSSEIDKPQIILVEPDSANVVVGEPVQLKAIVKDVTGKELDGRSVSWESTNRQVAIVSNDGIVTGMNPGQATITALAEGNHGSARITVLPLCTQFVMTPDDRPPTPPHWFGGTVLLDNSPVPDGTTISVIIKGACVLSATVESGSYEIEVSRPAGLGDVEGERVFFTIGNVVAEKSGVWEKGGATILDLRFGN